MKNISLYIQESIINKDLTLNDIVGDNCLSEKEIEDFKTNLSITKRINGNTVKISANKAWTKSSNEEILLILNEMLPYCTEVQYIKISLVHTKILGGHNTYMLGFYFNKEGSKFITINFNDRNSNKIVALHNHGNKFTMKYNADIIKALLQENNF